MEGNPYTPPQAKLHGDTPGSTAGKKTGGSVFQIFFSTKGRMSRKIYFLYIILPLLSVYFLMGIFLGFFPERLDQLLILYWVFTVVAGWISVVTLIKRIHDFGKSGWYCLLSIFPYVGVLFLLIFMGMPGSKGPNKYGPDPKASRPG